MSEWKQSPVLFFSLIIFRKKKNISFVSKISSLYMNYHISRVIIQIPILNSSFADIRSKMTLFPTSIKAFHNFWHCFSESIEDLSISSLN